MNETLARDLLEQAGDSVHVGAPPAFGRQAPSRHRWPVLAAAATVLVALLAALVVGQMGQDASPPTVARPHSRAELIPLTFGMTTDQARSTLMAAGLRVTVRVEQTCSETEGRVIGTDPRLGRTPTGAVTLIVSGPKDFICLNEPARSLAWQLIDLATGRGPGPDRTDDCCPAEVMHKLAAAATQWAPAPGVADIPPELVVTPTSRGFDLEIGETFNRHFRAYEHVNVTLQDLRVTGVSQARPS
jgi:hypothetical protein